jgi:hypothetical protein
MGHSTHFPGRFGEYHPGMEQVAEKAAGAPRAEICIPLAWLDPSLNLETLRNAQPPETELTFAHDAVTIAGAELVLRRQWFTTEDWARIPEGIKQGFVQRAAETEVAICADRRSAAPRRTPVLLARVRARSSRARGLSR